MKTKSRPKNSRKGSLYFGPPYTNKLWLVAVGFYLKEKLTAQKAMIKAGFSETYAKARSYLLARHPVLQRQELAMIKGIEASKDYIILEYLAILASEKLSELGRLRALDGLAKVCGYHVIQEGDGVPPAGGTNHIGDINVTEINLSDPAAIKSKIGDLLEKQANRFGFRLVNAPVSEN